MSSDEEYFDDEYIDEENDPFKVKKIIEEDYDVVIDEKVADFDEVFESVRCKITDLANHDCTMEKKVLDSLKRGTLK